MSTTETPTAPARSYWRAATIFCLLLLALAATAGLSMYEQFSAQIRDMQHKLQQSPQLRYVAVLLDDKGQPALLVTQQSGEGFLQLQRLNAVVEGGEDTMQLWALSASGPARSLGILPSRVKTPRLGAGEQTLAEVRTLAISVENKGGVAQEQEPRLPYLFSGSVVRKAQ